MPFRLLTLPLACMVLLVPSLILGDESPGNPPIAKAVSLSGIMKVSEALASLTKQSAIGVEDRRGAADKDITIEVKKGTFWQALDAIAAASDAQVDLYTRDGKLALKSKSKISSQEAQGQAVSYDRLFRTSLKRITASLDLETGQTAYLAAFEVAWEPGLQPFYLETRPQNLILKDELNKALPSMNLGKVDAPVDGRNSLQFETPLPSLPREAKRLGLLEGQLSVVAPSRMLTFSYAEDLDTLDAAVKKGLLPKLADSDVSCQIKQMKLSGKDHWTIQLALAYPPGNTKLDSNQSWIVNNELVLVSKDGKIRFPASSYVLDNATDRNAIVTYNFQDDPKEKRIRGKATDWKMTYRTPATVVTIPFTFSFKDVPLP